MSATSKEGTFLFKPMFYQAKRLIPPEQIARGTYKGLDYYVLNLGAHPCAYIDVTDTSLHDIEYEKIDIVVHGGLTYSRSSLATVDKTGWFIGWDYNHYGDFTGADMMFPLLKLFHPELQFGGKQWTTEEIIDEHLNVIYQIVKNQIL